jgi:hypothetical protein
VGKLTALWRRVQGHRAAGIQVTGRLKLLGATGVLDTQAEE